MKQGGPPTPLDTTKTYLIHIIIWIIIPLELQPEWSMKAFTTNALKEPNNEAFDDSNALVIIKPFAVARD